MQNGDSRNVQGHFGKMACHRAGLLAMLILTGFGLQGCKNLKEIEPPESVLSLPAPVTPIPLAVLPVVTPAPVSLQPLPPLPPLQPAQVAPEQPAVPLSAAVAQPRLVVWNNCSTLPIWIASSGNVPPPATRNVRILPGQSYSFYIPNAGLSSTRFWPKAWCDDLGQKCTLGSSGGDGQDCPAGGCAPPIDSKFEASFGAVGVDCAKDNKGCDWWDTSAVDGYSLPFKLEVDSQCPQAKKIDCLGLSFAECPAVEWLGKSVGNQDLRVVDHVSSKVVGCYSPCGKLTYSNWGNKVGQHTPDSDVAKMYCCPTPPVSPQQCRAGPVEQSAFVKLIHQKCKNVYGYAYDDAVGLQVCPAGTTYTWTLGCPTATEVVLG